MFDMDFQIRGTYATYWKALAKTQADKSASEVSAKFKIFNRYVDAYMLAPIIGLLNNRKGEINPLDENKDNAGMLAEILIKNQPRLKYIYRLIILLDDTTDISKEERINRAFREDHNKESVAEGMKTFNAYFLGGLEVLYENFVLSCTTNDDYITKIYEFVDEFKNEQDIESLEIDLDKLLRS